MAEDAALKPMSKNFSRVVLGVTILLFAIGVGMIEAWGLGASQTIGGVGVIAIMAAVVLAMDWAEDRRRVEE